jgi:hypothetical protein
VEENQGYLSMALAYIEIGRVCGHSDSELKNTHEYENAVAYQLYHSVELFYKHMLLKKDVKIKGHDISAIEVEYINFFSEEIYRLEHPFDFSNIDCSKLNPIEKSSTKRHLEKFRMKFMDQHLRYPSNHNTGGYSFKIEPCLFENMKEQMLKIDAIDG